MRGDEAMQTAAVFPMLPSPYRVRRVTKETADTFTMELVAQNGRDAIRYAPGQFNMLYVYGVGEVPISISGAPAKSGVMVHTTRAAGTVTRAMSAMKKNATLGLRGPFGTPWPVDDAQGHDIVMVAGGIGLAPLRPAMLHLIANRSRYKKVVLLYGARTPEDLLYRAELERWRAQLDLEVDVTVDRATPGWRGTVGVVTRLIGRAPFDPNNTVAMICGPETMIRFTTMELRQRGIGIDDIYVSMERNMKCGIGLCGHCQFGPEFVCKDGPVFRYSDVKDLLVKWEI
jgi:NAD(P)H-flavin reductase